MSFFASRKILIIGGIVLMLFIGIAIGRELEPNNMAPAGNNSAPKIAREAVSENKTEDNNIIAGIISENYSSQKATDGQNNSDSGLIKVIRVVDGDTIEIEGGEKVRYIGMDTPETVDPRKPVQCFGVEASAKNKELVDGKMARLEKDITDRDKYNRLLRYIWVGDTFINLELVKQGFAYSYSYPPDIKYQDQIVKAQQEATEAKRGLWNACPADPRINGIPSTASQNQTASSPSPGGVCLIKGNIGASGEKIYHLPGCNSYAKTQIDESRGEKWFCAESEAQAAGWRKALNCP